MHRHMCIYICIDVYIHIHTHKHPGNASRNLHVGSDMYEWRVIANSLAGIPIGPTARHSLGVTHTPKGF